MNKEELKTHLQITENQYLGIDTIDCEVDLENVTKIPKGFNPIVGGGLYLNSVTKIPKGFNPTVGYDFDVSSLTEIPKGFNPTVGGILYLPNVTKIPKGFNPTVGGYLTLNSVTEIPKKFNPTVGGSLYLDSVTEIPKGFNPTVGYSLYLRSVIKTPKGFNPTVGGNLYLSSVTKLPKGFNPMVGGYVHSKLTIPYTELGNNPITWEDGKYILADDIFTEVVYKKGNVYQVKKIGNPKEFYLVTDGTKWSHGDTLKEAYQDLVYKVTNRSKEDFEHATLDSVLTFEESVACYRTITGACSFGTKDFVQSNGIEEKDRTIREIIEITKGMYGSDSFVKFFNWLKKTLDILLWIKKN